jgi:hypothetical protein
MKMEQTECFETSAYKIQTPGNHPEENIQQRKWLLFVLSFFTLFSFPFLSLYLHLSIFLSFFMLLHLSYFSLLLVYLPLFRFIFVSSLRLLLFSPTFYCLFGLYLRLSPQKPAIISLPANSAHRLLLDLFCIISTTEGCSKSTVFIRRECGSSIAWPQGYDIGCRSRDNMRGCGGKELRNKPVCPEDGLKSRCCGRINGLSAWEFARSGAIRNHDHFHVFRWLVYSDCWCVVRADCSEGKIWHRKDTQLLSLRLLSAQTLVSS